MIFYSLDRIWGFSWFTLGFPGGSDSKESACNAGVRGLIPESGRSPGEGQWQPSPVFLPGESHGQRSLAGYSPWVTKSRAWLSDLTFTFYLLYWLLVVVDLQIFHVAFSTMVTFTPLGKEQCGKKVMPHIMYMGFSRGTSGKGPPANAGNRRDSVLIPGSGSSPGVGNGNLLQYSCLENSSDRGAWQAAVHRLAKSRTWQHPQAPTLLLNL